MPTASLTSLPRPLLFGLFGMTAGLVLTLTLGELAWWLLRPAEAHSTDESPGSRAPTPPAQVGVAASPHVSVYPGRQNTFAVRVARGRFEGPVAVKFLSPTPWMSASDLTIPADQTGGPATVMPTVGAQPGTYRLTAVATATAGSQTLTARTTVEVAVVPAPPPPPRLAVSVSPKVQLCPLGKNTLEVRVARGDFDGPVTVAFSGLPEGVAAPTSAVEADKTDATVELRADGNVKPGAYAVVVTAQGGPKGEVTATAQAGVVVLANPTLPLDVVFVLDTTGSMKKPIEGISASLPAFAAELAKARLDVRFGLVAFQDTTLGQPLRILRVNNEKMTADVGQFAAAVAKLRLGGGGGEGESSLDGIAEAADYPFRGGAARVVVLVTDGGPKRMDGRVKSMEEAVEHLRDSKIDQLQIAALPEHRKAFEPLWDGAKGQFFDLKEAAAAEKYAKLMQEAGQAIVAAAPKPPLGKAEPSTAAPQPSLAPRGIVQPPGLPPGVEPDEPSMSQGEPAATGPSETPGSSPDPPIGARARAVLGWSAVIIALVCSAILVGQCLSDGRPDPSVLAAGYGGGVLFGTVAGAVCYAVFDWIGVPLLGRLGGGCLLGLSVGSVVPVAERLFREEEPLSLDPPLEIDPPVSSEKATPPAPEPLELDDAPLPVPAGAAVAAPPPLPSPPAVPAVSATAPPIIKPNISAPKPRDGCPGCGRSIPGAVGQRYCMVCDQTF